MAEPAVLHQFFSHQLFFAPREARAAQTIVLLDQSGALKTTIFHGVALRGGKHKDIKFTNI